MPTHRRRSGHYLLHKGHDFIMIAGKDSNIRMLAPALVLVALVVHSAAFSPSQSGLVRFSSRLSYANNDEDYGVGGTWRHAMDFQLRQHDTKGASTVRKESPSSIPQRAIPHVRIANNVEAATRAGYVIRRTDTQNRLEGNNRQMGNEHSRQDRQTDRRGVRPLRSIRRIIHRSGDEQPLRRKDTMQGNQIGMQTPDKSIDVRVRNSIINNRRSRLSLSNRPQLDEFLDKPEQLAPNKEDRKGARRVTFKATRESTKAILSKPFATLTEYMTQPVSQYSLLSFHDANEGSKQRRWLVRRLTNEESQRYISSCSDEDDADVMEESNLFRLAVPLLPIIGWDLTPVIDLEVTVGANLNGDDVFDDDTNCESLDETCEMEVESSTQKWAPLRGIRRRIRQRGDDASMSDASDCDVVKIRSLSVSLLSTQEEVKQVMSNDNDGPQRKRGSSTGVQRVPLQQQKEAIDMVSKVEDWLRPHITFEAELSWDDTVRGGSKENQNEPSTVTVKSTAITSLTIPKIPSDVLRKAVPSSFLVKRLGATLTSQALAICLPRFLRQLEKDYNRWAGLELSVDKEDMN